MADNLTDNRAAVKRLLTLHNLSHVEVKLTARGVSARAYPSTFHPIVRTRREAALRAAAGPDGSISIAAATRANEEAVKGHLCTATGETAELALGRLRDLLNRGEF